MEKMTFKAYAVTHEIDLNKIAIECNIPKKYTWEEPLILQDKILSSILQMETVNDQKILVFSFGSIVFINFSSEGIHRFMKYIIKFEPEINLKKFETYKDDYELHISDTGEIDLTDEYVKVPSFEIFYPELISIVIAKSVALEKSEFNLGEILDKLENIIIRFEKGDLRVSDKELAKTTSRIVRHEYNTIAYIMILDKPDITWQNSNAEEFYSQMSEFFELNDRYEVIKTKTDILNNIMDGFSSISHARRGLFIEWIIIILILLEVIIMIIELIR